MTGGVALDDDLRPEDVLDVDGLITSLSVLRARAGNPPYRALAKRVGPLLRPPRELPFRTLAQLFQPGRRRLDLDLLLATVRALGLAEADVVRWRDACVRAHVEAKRVEPAGGFRSLPADIGTFVGRAPELDRVVTLARGGGGGDSGAAPALMITAIDGMAGIGKSTLAVRAAHLLADRFPDGQLFLDLHGHTQGMPPRDPAEALASLLTALGVPPGRIPAAPDDRAAAFRDRLSGTRTLILLDNAATEAQVRPLIPGDAGCLVLITSRRRLKGLDDAHIVALDVLPEADAVDLLRSLVGSTRAPADDPGWQQVAALCGHLPLALRVAASLMRHRPAWTLDHLAGKLRAALAEGSFSDGERDLWAVFDLSYQALADDQRELLRRLGLVPGRDVDAHAVAALLGTGPDRAEQLLQDLVDHHLLAEHTVGRYWMHDLVRAYSRSRAEALDPEGDRDRALSRLLHYYSYCAQRASQAATHFLRPEPAGPAPDHVPELSDPDRARDWLRTEQSNLDTAFTHAHDRRLHEHVVALAAGLADTFHTDGPWNRALDVHQTAVDAGGVLGRPAARAAALTDLGRARQLIGDYSGAVDALTQAIGIHRETGDRIGEAAALSALARARHQTADLAGAADALTRALEIYRAAGNRNGEAIALTDLGRWRHSVGDYPGAEQAFTRALETHRMLGNRVGEAELLTDLGRARQATGDLAGAERTLTLAMEIHRATGNRRGEAIALTNLGRLRQQTGDRPGAEQALTSALAAHRALGHRNGEAGTLVDLGRVRYLAGDHHGAEDAFVRALEIFRETGERGNEAWALNHHAAAIAATGDRSRALGIYRQALAMNRELNKPDDEAISLEGIGDHHLAAGDVPQGTAFLGQALEIYERLGMSVDAERVRLRLADCGELTAASFRNSRS